jgi:hypothetical protein
MSWVDFQIMMSPPEEPTNERNSKESKAEGQNFLMKARSKFAF